MVANYIRIPFVQRLARLAFLTPILNGLWLAVPFLCLVDSDAFWVYLVAAFLIFSPKISFMFRSYLCLVLFPSFILVNRRILSGRYYYSMMDNCLYVLGQDNMNLASRYKRQD